MEQILMGIIKFTAQNRMELVEYLVDNIDSVQTYLQAQIFH